MGIDNKSFRVTVFHHSNRDFYMEVKTLDDVKKLKNKIWLLITSTPAFGNTVL